MSKKLPLLMKITSVVLLVIFLQVNTSFAQRPPQPTVPGEQTFVVRPVPTEITGAGIGASFPKAPTSDVKGVSLFGITGLINCTTAAGHKIETSQYSYMLYLDEESLESTLTTNQRAKTANLKLVGRMRMWEAKFIENDTDCGSETEEIEGGAGGLEITVTNQIHPTPLNFIVATARGRVHGPGFSDSLSIPSDRQPEQIKSIDTGYLDKYLPQTNNPQQVLEALRKSGREIPEGLEERLKQSQNMSTNVPKHTLLGFMRGSSKDVAIGFYITSGFQADMLVYKPKAMSSGGGGSAKVTLVDSNNSILNGSFLRNAGYSLGGNDFLFGKRTENLPTVAKKQASGGIFVSRSNRDKVQAFVNLDNDNKNETFDLDDKEKIVDEDNDLVKVVLRIKQKPKPQRKGIAKFEVKAGQEFVKVWERESANSDKLKEYKKKDLSENDENEFKEGTGDFKGFLIKELWVEGIKPQTKQKQSKFSFTYSERPRALEFSVEDEFELTVLGIEKVELLAKNNGVEFVDKLITKPANTLDDDPNHRHPYGGRPLKTKGVRIFPGKRLLSAKLKGQGCGEDGGKIVNTLDRDPRDKVDVKVTLSVEPVEPVNVYFDSFDVDDPTASGEGNPEENNSGISKVYDDESWIDNELNDSDNRGKVANAVHPNTGKLLGENPESGILAVEFSGKEKSFEFQVTKQPGDNFRIVGSGSEDFFENLENDDNKLNYGGASNDNKQRITDKFVLDSKPNRPEDAEVRKSEKYVSDTLAVWRIFYGERDFMGNVQGNSVEGKIVSISSGLFSNSSTVQLDKNIRLSFGLVENRGLKDSFENGKLKVGGTEYEITANTADYSQPDSVTVVGKVPKNLVNKDYEIVDDDKSQYNDGRGYHFGNGGRLWDPDVKAGPGRNGVDTRFEPAYIVSDFGTLKNACIGPKFSINVLEDKSSSYESHYRFDNKDLHTNKDFWTVYVLGSFQATSWEDGDPNSEGAGSGGAGSGIAGITAGYADTSGIGVTIFLSGVIEKNKGEHHIATDNGRGEQDAVVHELGHLFNAQHNQGRLMDQEHHKFSNRSIAAIRDSENP